MFQFHLVGSEGKGTGILGFALLPRRILLLVESWRERFTLDCETFLAWFDLRTARNLGDSLLIGFLQATKEFSYAEQCFDDR